MVGTVGMDQYMIALFLILMFILGYFVCPSKQYLITSLLNPQIAAEQPYNESNICT